MENREQQRETKPQSETEKGNKKEGLPLEESPYLKYKDLEDYKRQGYGTEGHKQPKEGRGAGATEAPTLSGAAVTSEAELAATEVINRQGVP